MATIHARIPHGMCGVFLVFVCSVSNY